MESPPVDRHAGGCPEGLDEFGTACEGGLCVVVCSGGQHKFLQCKTNTTYNKTRGKATLVICKTGVKNRG